jgi:hypothetical protein
MAGKLNMVLAVCFLLPASVIDVQAMPGGLAQRASNPDLLEVAVRVPSPKVPLVNGIRPNTTTRTPSGTMSGAHPGKPLVNGIGPADAVTKGNGTK